MYKGHSKMPTPDAGIQGPDRPCARLVYIAAARPEGRSAGTLPRRESVVLLAYCSRFLTIFKVLAPAPPMNKPGCDTEDW